MEKLDTKDLVMEHWRNMMKAGTDLDAWGQPVEAVAEYHKVLRALKDVLMAGKDDQFNFTENEKRVLSKVMSCVELRTKGLEKPGSIHAISLIDLKQIQNELPRLVSSRPNQFPVDVMAAQAYVLAHSDPSLALEVSAPDVVDDDLDPAEQKARGSLLPRPVPIDGRTIVMVRVEKIGLKHSEQYIEPYMVVYVKDRTGRDLSPSQRTPLAAQKCENHVIFNTDVFIQRHLEMLPEGFCIMFEFRHFKTNKRQQSSKCWSFLERDEIREGPCCVEIYKKPLDPRRKRIRLLSTKPLYLHLRIFLN